MNKKHLFRRIKSISTQSQICYNLKIILDVSIRYTFYLRIDFIPLIDLPRNFPIKAKSNIAIHPR